MRNKYNYYNYIVMFDSSIFCSHHFAYLFSESVFVTFVCFFDESLVTHPPTESVLALDMIVRST